MRYKGYIIELNPYGQKGFDYVFYSETAINLLFLDDEPVGIGRSVVDCKNQIELILLEKTITGKYTIGQKIKFNDVVYTVYDCGRISENSKRMFMKAKSNDGTVLYDEY